VHVLVADVNDNRPVFTHPSLADNHLAVVELESSAPVGHLVTLVTAVDDDVGVNARLSYSIVDEQSEWLSVDAESGEVRVAAPLPRDSVTYDLLIAASDAGTPVRLSSHATLHVVVRPSAVVASSRRRSAGSGVPAGGRDMPWWLVAGTCLVAALVSVILAAFCLSLSVKRRRQQARRRATTPPARRTTPPPPLALTADVDPLRRHRLDDISALEQSPGMSTAAAAAAPCGNYINYVPNTPGCKSAAVSTVEPCC